MTKIWETITHEFFDGKWPQESDTPTMVIRVVEFSRGGTKLERFLPKEQCTQRKLLNFENWFNGCQKLGIILKYGFLKVR